MVFPTLVNSDHKYDLIKMSFSSTENTLNHKQQILSAVHFCSYYYYYSNSMGSFVQNVPKVSFPPPHTQTIA